MRSRSTSVALGAAVVAAVCLAATAADAKCERFSYLVNDYGKEGPTRDAKNLLDKHIVKWAAEKGIKNYTVGKKSVKCELFLNFVVFDEHTCTATVQVCWGATAFQSRRQLRSPHRLQKSRLQPRRPRSPADLITPPATAALRARAPAPDRSACRAAVPAPACG